MLMDQLFLSVICVSLENNFHDLSSLIFDIAIQ